MSDLRSRTTFFDSYEEREDAFRREVGFKLARRHRGPALFWKDFSTIAAQTAAAPGNGRVCAITSNPRDCLAFATAEQILGAALMCARGRGDDARVHDIAARFGLSELLNQPVRTLSGGESVKLALAKTYGAIPSCSGVVISSPFSWLSPHNRRLLEELAGTCEREQKRLSILALSGEDDLTPFAFEEPGTSLQSDSIRFGVELSEVKIPLTLSLNPLDDTVPFAAVRETALEMESPCLISGENGQGKSLVARAVCGSLALRGRAVIRNGPHTGTARLLFQDVQTQTLMRSFPDLAGGYRGEETAAVLAVYNDIRKRYNASIGSSGAVGGAGINLVDELTHTLLDIKAMLVAVRLAAAPSALILDEPDWGLSRSASKHFVSAVTESAHCRNVPILLISHKPWWRSMMRSFLEVSRTDSQRPASADQPVFTISLHRGERER